MSELIAQVDPDTGEVIGEVDRTVAHRDGIWHAAIHVWILDDRDRALLQQRSYAKAQFPGIWDISAAGHMRAGDDGFREVAEELGVEVDPDAVEDIGVLTIDHDAPPLRDRERPRVHLWRSGLPLDAFWFADGEAIGLAAMPVHELRELLDGTAVRCDVLRDGEISVEEILPGDVSPLNNGYWQQVLAALERP